MSQGNVLAYVLGVHLLLLSLIGLKMFIINPKFRWKNSITPPLTLPARPTPVSRSPALSTSSTSWN